MDAQQIYKDNVSHSHEAAINAVYQAGYQDGVESLPVIETIEPIDVKPKKKKEAVNE